jgi:hypothetical protein
MRRMGVRDSSKCADCRCDLLAVANNPVHGFVAAIQFVRLRVYWYWFIGT